MESTREIFQGVGGQVALTIFEHDDLAVMVAVNCDLALVHCAKVVLGLQRVAQALREPLRERFCAAADGLFGGGVRLERQLSLKFLLRLILRRGQA